MPEPQDETRPEAEHAAEPQIVADIRRTQALARDLLAGGMTAEPARAERSGQGHLDFGPPPGRNGTQEVQP